MLEIRKARLEDVKKIAALEQACFSDPLGEASLRDGIQYENYLTLCAYQGDNLCGYLAALFCLDEGELLRIATSQLFRRQGVAKQLMVALLEACRQREACLLRLEVREGNGSAISLYESFRFRRVGLRKNYYQNPTENALLMDAAVE